MMGFERTTHQSLEYRIERVLYGRFRSKKVSDARTLSEELAQKIMEEVPDAAFEAVDPFDHGIVTFSSTVSERSARDLCDELRSAHLTLSSNKPLRLVLNSPGGSVYDGLLVASTIQEIQRAGRVVDIHVAGCAMSMGSVILQAGTRRTIDAYGFLMMHEISYEVEHVKVSTHADFVDEVKALQQAVFALYSARTGKPVDYYLKRFDRRDWTLSAREALEERLVDDIVPQPSYRRAPRRTAHHEG